MAPKSRQDNRLLRFTIRYLLHHLFNVQMIMDCPLPGGTYIVSSNHMSWIDPILLTLAWPQKTTLMYIGPRPVVTNTGWKRWFIGSMPEVVLTPQRSGWLGKEAYQLVMQGFDAGRCLLIFPEGDAYPNESSVMPYANGVAHFALVRGLPVIPVGICGTADLYYRKQLIVHIGMPIDVPCSPHPNKKLVYEKLAEIREGTRVLIENYQDPVVASRPMHWLTHLM
jgi:1-acyl-sn-glycerol-3-phosphate acyltransferase